MYIRVCLSYIFYPACYKSQQTTPHPFHRPETQSYVQIMVSYMKEYSDYPSTLRYSFGANTAVETLYFHIQMVTTGKRLLVW
jgi:hypothetical protein